MKDKNISQEVLDKIKDIKPKPRWEFLLKNYSIWLLGLVSLLLGSLAFAVILYMMINNDWDVHQYIAGSMSQFILLTLPYFWLIFLGLFILAAHLNFKYTKRGYKFSFFKVALGSIVISMLFGAFLHNIGVGQAIDNIMAKRMPFYKELINKRQQIWLQPEQGLLAGIVIGVGNEQTVVEDINGQLWYISDLSTSTPPMFNLQIGDRIRMLGERIDSENFEAHQILPMRGMRWMHNIHERKVKGMRIIR